MQKNLTVFRTPNFGVFPDFMLISPKVPKTPLFGPIIFALAPWWVASRVIFLGVPQVFEIYLDRANYAIAGFINRLNSTSFKERGIKVKEMTSLPTQICRFGASKVKLKTKKCPRVTSGYFDIRDFLSKKMPFWTRFYPG